MSGKSDNAFSVETENVDKYSIDINKNKSKQDASNKKFCKTGNINVDNDRDNSFNYLPQLFLRCHCKDNDPFDNNTSIWSAAFEPQSNSCNGSQFVATCGGNSVCIIDVNAKPFDSKMVVTRYIDEDRNEEFVSLAWSVLTMNARSDYNSEETIILAVGGKKQILLMFTKELTCYERIDAHEDQINALTLHRNNPFWLFSASYDGKIKLWHLSTDEANVSKLLKTIDTRMPLLSLCHSSEFDAIIASGYKGVIFWCDISKNNDELNLGHLTSTKTNQQMVDGLFILPDDPNTLALKTYKTKFITIIDLKLAIDEIRKTSLANTVKFRQISLTKVKKAQLNWCNDTKYPYIYMSAQCGLLVSGAPNGQMLLYNTHKFKAYYDTNIIGDPDIIVEWPAIDNEIKDNKYVIDDKKFVIINAVAISPDLKYIVGCTNLNLVCIWYRS